MRVALRVSKGPVRPETRHFFLGHVTPVRSGQVIFGLPASTFAHFLFKLPKRSSPFAFNRSFRFAESESMLTTTLQPPPSADPTSSRPLERACVRVCVRDPPPVCVFYCPALFISRQQEKQIIRRHSSKDCK